MNAPSSKTLRFHTTNKLAIISIDRSAALFVAFSAIVLGLIQKYCPSSERPFATSVCACCLVIFAAVADPSTFFGSLFTLTPFFRHCMPRRYYLHIVKSIEYLEEGERRVAAMETKKGEKDDSNVGDGEVSTQMLLDEIRNRIQWKFVLPSIITGACVQAIGYQKPKLIGQMMDFVVKDGATIDSAFWPFIRQLVLFVIFDYIFISMREYFKHAATHRYNAEVKTDMLTNLLDQEEDYIHSPKHSVGLVHLMNRETQRMQGIINGSLPRLFSAIVSTAGGMYTLHRVDFRLALLGVAVKSPIMAMLQRLAARDIVRYGKLYEESNGRAQRIARNSLNPEIIHLLQAFGVQRQIVESYRAKQEEFINYLEFTHFRQTLLCMFPHGLNNAEDILLLAMGLMSVAKGNLTLGSYMAFRSHLSLLDQGPKELLGFWNDIVQIRMSASVYFELMYRKSRIPCSVQRNDGQGKLENTSEGITLILKNVSFAYHLNPNLKVLHDVNLVLKPGKIVALCGGSGGGKTTITRLLQRFYDPTEGRIEMNGTDIRSLDVAWLRSQIAVIDQDPILPDMSIGENIALGLGQEYTQGSQWSSEVCLRVLEAAKLAEAHEFIITKCENGYDTPVRQIHRLSGGQRQRIAIARALISRASVLICDEVTSALDADTEKSIVSTLRDAMKGKSVLLIAHRMSTIRKADEILFLENGMIIERGTHDELLQMNERYAGYLKTVFNHE